jgi:hypothetical protein
MALDQTDYVSASKIGMPRSALTLSLRMIERTIENRLATEVLCEISSPFDPRKGHPIPAPQGFADLVA